MGVLHKHLFPHLDARDVSAMARTCKGFRNFVMGMKYNKLEIRQWVDGGSLSFCGGKIESALTPAETGGAVARELEKFVVGELCLTGVASADKATAIVDQVGRRVHNIRLKCTHLAPQTDLSRFGKVTFESDIPFYPFHAPLIPESIQLGRGVVLVRMHMGYWPASLSRAGTVHVNECEFEEEQEYFYHPDGFDEPVGSHPMHVEGRRLVFRNCDLQPANVYALRSCTLVNCTLTVGCVRRHVDQPAPSLCVRRCTFVDGVDEVFKWLSGYPGKHTFTVRGVDSMFAVEVDALGRVASVL